MSVEKKIRTQIDWSKMRADVDTRIVVLQKTCESLPDTEASDIIVRDLVIPCLKKLMEFCDSIKTDGEEDE